MRPRVRRAARLPLPVLLSQQLLVQAGPERVRAGHGWHGGALEHVHHNLPEGEADRGADESNHVRVQRVALRAPHTRCRCQSVCCTDVAFAATWSTAPGAANNAG